MREITIGITDCGSYPNYERWMLNERGVKTIRLSPKENNLNDLVQCDGVILSGGEDMHPRYYNKPDYLQYCDAIDEQRDQFEWGVLTYTEKNNLPVLGICRGLQVANVFFGGTLIPDIPTFGKYNHAKFPDEDRYHTIQVDPNSTLYKISEKDTGTINSAHHQSCDLVGKDLVVNAISPDGVIEGMERKNTRDKAYLLLVQWHPERMKDQDNVFSKAIKGSFLTAVRAHNIVV
ncbi:MAG TPA: gamma-glutamyl-gamma-aminobutyrate hydrolase family protein [Ohtaekwangia sp.]|nr:gamma-glutamyl-gamma-aminobutyrate hydrolase family protein [Ohtaekwangia sp.]